MSAARKRNLSFGEKGERHPNFGEKLSDEQKLKIYAGFRSRFEGSRGFCGALIGALVPHDALDCSATPDAMCRRTNIGRTCVLNVWNIEENCMEKLETITARRSVTVLWYIDREWTADPSILWIVYTSIHLQRQYKGK